MWRPFNVDRNDEENPSHEIYENYLFIYPFNFKDSPEDRGSKDGVVSLTK